LEIAMNRREFFSIAIAGAGTAAVGLGLGRAEAAQPHPSTAKTLEEALSVRQSIREYAPLDLPEALLLRLLWAACGVNRPASGKRTAPSAYNRQEVSVYVARRDGLFFFDCKAGALRGKSGADLRAATGRQAYVATAPVNLVYVADMNRVAGGSQDEKTLTAGLDTGYISQNVYLFCAAEGLATVARTGLDHEALHKTMGLAAGERVIMAQCVGYPKG
jgi:nitroreductase